jgi:hypothetical protein
MPANPQPKSAGRALVWVLLAVTATLGVGIPIYRAVSQGSGSGSDDDSARRLGVRSIYYAIDNGGGLRAGCANGAALANRSERWVVPRDRTG